MSSLIHFEIRNLPAMRVVGKAAYPKMDMKENPIPAFWSQCFQEGLFAAIEALPHPRVDDAYVGFMCGWGGGKDTYTYIVGMLMAEGCPVPEGFDFFDCPASSAAVGWIRGPEKDNYQAAHALTQKKMEDEGYRFDESAGWCMELYNCPRFTRPDEKGEVILDYYIPCVLRMNELKSERR